MAEAKKILVIDDHFEMLEFLRSMLELSSEDYEVLAVPSAEEGLMELPKGNFDLLITDVRLPGMSGFDLVRRVKRMGMDLPVIIITAYSSDHGRKEADELGVFHYFQKPLDTDDVLATVTKALYGDAPAAAATADPVPVVQAIEVTPELRKRLDTLRIETGALQIMLAVSSGQIVHTVGSDRKLDYPKIAAIMARNVNDSMLLADELKNRSPFMVQYQAGNRSKLFCANIGPHYFITLFFEVRAKRGAIGTIWGFTQRAVNDLAAMLPTPTFTEGQPITAQPVVLPPPLKKIETAPLKQPPIPEEPEEIELAPAENLPSNITIIEEPAADEVVPVSEDFLDIGADELAALLAGEAPVVEDEVDLDAFWDDAFSTVTSEQEEQVQGMSVEEARQKGLIPPADGDA